MAAEFGGPGPPCIEVEVLAENRWERNYVKRGKAKR